MDGREEVHPERAAAAEPARVALAERAAHGGGQHALLRCNHAGRAGRLDIACPLARAAESVFYKPLLFH